MSLHAALTACLLFTSADAFSLGSSFVPRHGAASSSSPALCQARGLSMAMTTPKPDTKSKFAPLAVPGSDTPTKKNKEDAAADDKGEWRMDLAEPKLESECGADYIPLLTALKLGNYEEADQLTRDLLIWIGGEGTRKRGFVYFAEVPGLPRKDMETIDRLWVAYSKGKFGFSVQKEIWNSRNVKGDFSKFVAVIDWNVGPCGGCVKQCSGCPGTLKRWTGVGSGGNEYVYDLAKAKKGHLPLTSALRGTYLLKKLLAHPAFGTEKTMGDALVTADFRSKNPGNSGGMGASNWVGGSYSGVQPVFEEIRIAASKVKMDVSNYAKKKNPWDV